MVGGCAHSWAQDSVCLQKRKTNREKRERARERERRKKRVRKWKRQTTFCKKSRSLCWQSEILDNAKRRQRRETLDQVSESVPGENIRVCFTAIILQPLCKRTQDFVLHLHCTYNTTYIMCNSFFHTRSIPGIVDKTVQFFSSFLFFQSQIFQSSS